MSKPKKLKSLSGWDWETLVAAWRYFEHRHTISAYMFPAEIIERFFHGDYEQKACDDIAWQFAHIDHGSRGCDDWEDNGLFGETDRLVWCKFYSFCKAWCDGFRTLTVSNGERTEKMEAFYCEANKRWYPKKEYVGSPHAEIYIPEKNIKETEDEN